jgi:hypothetical protein
MSSALSAPDTADEGGWRQHQGHADATGSRRDLVQQPLHEELEEISLTPGLASRNKGPRLPTGLGCVFASSVVRLYERFRHQWE